MTDQIIALYKKAGETPLECINRVRSASDIYAHVPMTYAGRLDPLAEGVLIALAGDACMRKDEFLALPKEYEVTVLFGYATDTYDLMGKIISSAPVSVLPENVERILEKFTGKIRQKYPVYSSRPVEGKPLFRWAREGRLGEIEIPSHDVFVDSITLVSSDQITAQDLFTHTENVVGAVSGDFRQEEILSLWHDALSENDMTFTLSTLRIVCSSGTYVRAIAHEMGEMLGVPALAYKIVRTKVGTYTIEDTK